MSFNVRQVYRGKRQADFLRYIGSPRELRGIEIGALDFPTFNKEESQVKFVDNLSYEELMEKYKDSSVFNPQEIVRPDYVVKTLEEYHTIGERFDYIIACHVLEHVPNPWGFIRTLGELLVKRGKLFLTIPDKRFIAEDRWRENTPFPHLLADDLGNATTLTFDHYFDFVWGREIMKKTDGPAMWKQAQDLYKKRTFDIHAHVWTDRAFRQHLFWAKEWGCIPLKICLHGMTPYSAGLNEFAVILERGEGEIHGWQRSMS